MIPRFRQSLAKTILNDCPALVKLELDGERTREPSRAMDAGSLLDYLVFQQNDRYEVVDATYKSGRRAGEQCTDWVGKEAQTAREEIRGRGLLPVLQAEIDELQPVADRITSRLDQLAAEVAGDREWQILYQPKMQWRTSLGVDAEGTPDVLLLMAESYGDVSVLSVDVKHTAALPQKKFNAQVFSMGWDIQGSTYGEGCVHHAVDECGANTAKHVGHIILATSSIHIGLPAVARRLSETYMAIGEKRWQKAQALWMQCWESGEWPGYDEDPAEPPRYVAGEAFGYAESDLSDLNLNFGTEETR